jgi:outer membrane receptor protein involved in Fe transport
VVAAAALFAACETTMPTQSDVASMDAASAERALVLMKAARDTNVAYTVDGKTVSASEAHRLASDTITAIFMSKGGGRVDTIHLRLKLADAERDTVMAFKGTLSREVAVTSAADQAMRRRSPDGAADSGFVVSKFANGVGDSRVTIMIDGVVASDGQLRALNRDAIKSIEIIKGPSAARENPGVPNAERGIVKIFTKAGGAK